MKIAPIHSMPYPDKVISFHLKIMCNEFDFPATLISCQIYYLNFLRLLIGLNSGIFCQIIFVLINSNPDPSLNTQSCIKGLFVVWDFCFWAVWAARPVLKKKGCGPIKSNFWGDFLCFQGQQIFFDPQNMKKPP